MIPVVRSSVAALGRPGVATSSRPVWAHRAGRVPPWIVATGAAAVAAFVLVLLG